MGVEGVDMRNTKRNLSLFKVALIAGSALAMPTTAWAQQAADAEKPVDEIIVTGFRQSLQAALNVKKNSVAAVDAVVAEDIAKFPDQNLA